MWVKFRVQIDDCKEENHQMSKILVEKIIFDHLKFILF
jgi:hypothetical protein